MASKREATQRDVLQAAAVVTVKDGCVALPPQVLDYLGTSPRKLFLKIQKEILLTPVPSQRASQAELKQDSLVLPDSVVSSLDVADGDAVAMVRRKNAVALKRAEPGTVEAARCRREKVPQVAAIVRASMGGRVPLKANVRKLLGNGPLFLHTDREILLGAHDGNAGKAAAVEKNRLLLPDRVIEALALGKGAYAAFVERENGVAIKRFELVQREGQEAAAYDIETPFTVTRVAETNPAPESVLARLTAVAKGMRLKHEVRNFLRGRKTFDAWRARRTLQLSDADEEGLRQRFIRERLDTQRADGSWDGEVVLTARLLRELSDLGLAGAAPGVARGVEWLLGRRETDLEPGFFLLSDEIASEMERIHEARKRGSNDRFRKGHSQFPRGELDAALKGDDLVHMPCGPRVTWPNAYALEALIALGYEEHPRVQRAIGTLMNGGWCECGHQGHEGREIRLLSMHEIQNREREQRDWFRLGGIPSLAELGKMDMSKTCGLRMPRTGCRRESGRTVYPLQMPCDFAPCGLIPIRAFARARDERIRTYAETYLWELVVKQNGREGAEPGWNRYACGHAGLLQVFAAFDHLAAQIGILKWLPWIVETQNPDGSWGRKAYSDAATFAVLSALPRVSALLPDGFMTCR